MATFFSCQSYTGVTVAEKCNDFFVNIAPNIEMEI